MENTNKRLEAVHKRVAKGAISLNRALKEIRTGFKNLGIIIDFRALFSRSSDGTWKINLVRKFFRKCEDGWEALSDFTEKFEVGSIKGLPFTVSPQ